MVYLQQEEVITLEDREPYTSRLARNSLPITPKEIQASNCSHLQTLPSLCSPLLSGGAAMSASELRK